MCAELRVQAGGLVEVCIAWRDVRTCPCTLSGLRSMYTRGAAREEVKPTGCVLACITITN